MERPLKCTECNWCREVSRYTDDEGNEGIDYECLFGGGWGCPVTPQDQCHRGYVTTDEEC